MFPETVFGVFAEPALFLGVIVNVYTPADSSPSKVYEAVADGLFLITVVPAAAPGPDIFVAVIS